MKISHCKLSKKVQLKLLEYFVLEVTARSAADLLEINANSAALYYRKIRQVIAYHLALEEAELFDGHIELDESYFGGVRKGVIPPKRAASKSRINTSPAFSAGRVSLLKPSYAFALE